MLRVAAAFLAFALGLLSQPGKPLPGELVPWQAEFQRIAGSEWLWRACQVKAESNFNPRAVSPVGAFTAAQFMPGTWREQKQKRRIPQDAGPDDIPAVLTAQNYYMLDQERLMRVRGRLTTPRGVRDGAHGSYNAGAGNILAAIRQADALGIPSTPGTEDAWMRALPLVTKAHAIETITYVGRINGYHADYTRRLR